MDYTARGLDRPQCLKQTKHAKEVHYLHQAVQVEKTELVLPGSMCGISGDIQNAE